VARIQRPIASIMDPMALS